MEIFLDTYTWFTISFLLFSYIVYRHGGPVIIGTLDKQIREIKSDIETAESLRVEAHEMLAQYQRKQRDAAKEAEKILKEANEAVKKIKAHAEDDLSESIARREAQLEDRLNRMQQTAIEEIRNYAASLSLQAAQQLIIEKLDKNTNTKLVEQSISDITSNIH